MARDLRRIADNRLLGRDAGFLNKPVNVKQLKQHVQDALVRYLAFEEAPKLLQRHRVQESA